MLPETEKKIKEWSEMKPRSYKKRTPEWVKKRIEKREYLQRQWDGR